MSGKPKILVFHLKELIYTAIFVVLGILLIFLLIFMFKPDSSDKASSDVHTQYLSGVYTTSLTLNGANCEVEVVVDSNHINSVNLKNVDESIGVMYPLMESSIKDISNQIVENQSTDSITYSEDNKYTYSILIDAINQTLEKAKK